MAEPRSSSRTPRVVRSASTPSGASSSPSSNESSRFERSVSVSSGEFTYVQSPPQMADDGTPRLLVNAREIAAEPSRMAGEAPVPDALPAEQRDYYDESAIVIRRASEDPAVGAAVRLYLARIDTAPPALRKPSEWAEWHCWRHGRQGNTIPKPSIEEIREALSATHIAESRKCIQQSAADAWAAQEEFKRGVEKAMARYEAAVSFMGGNLLGSSSVIGRWFEQMKGKISTKIIRA